MLSDSSGESPTSSSFACLPLNPHDASQIASLFRALADPVRLRLLSLITCCSDGELCVCDLSVHFDVTGPTISHHLKVLRLAGLIRCERRGTWLYYQADNDVLRWLSIFLNPDGSAWFSALLGADVTIDVDPKQGP
jgi:ArsR family transcriptional regulator